MHIAHSEPVDEEQYASTHMDSYRDAGSQHTTDGTRHIGHATCIVIPIYFFTLDDCLGAGYHTIAHFQVNYILVLFNCFTLTTCIYVLLL